MNGQDFPVRVSTLLPASTFKRLAVVAREHDTTVGALVAELVRRELTPAAKPVRGRRSRYTPELGERIAEARRFNRSYGEIAAELGISLQTAQKYLRIYETDQRVAVIAARDQQDEMRRTA